MWTLITGWCREIPFKATTHPQFGQGYGGAILGLPEFRYVEQELRETVARCMLENPKERPEPEELFYLCEGRFEKEFQEETDEETQRFFQESVFAPRPEPKPRPVFITTRKPRKSNGKYKDESGDKAPGKVTSQSQRQPQHEDDGLQIMEQLSRDHFAQAQKSHQRGPSQKEGEPLLKNSAVQSDQLLTQPTQASVNQRLQKWVYRDPSDAAPAAPSTPKPGVPLLSAVQKKKDGNLLIQHRQRLHHLQPKGQAASLEPKCAEHRQPSNGKGKAPQLPPLQSKAQVVSPQPKEGLPLAQPNPQHHPHGLKRKDQLEESAPPDPAPKRIKTEDIYYIRRVQVPIRKTNQQCR